MKGGEAAIQVSESTDAGYLLDHFLDGIPDKFFLGVLGVGTWLPHSGKSGQTMLS